jgi:transporter family-2 protein
MTPWTFVGAVVAVCVGVLLPLQALINARLGHATTGALMASFVSFLVGTLVLAVAVLATRTPWPSWQQASTLPAWHWAGGVIGAAFVLTATVLVPRIGAAALISLAVCGQLLGSLLLDHFGVLGAARPADPLRILGAVLVGVGALLVLKPWQAG